MLSHKKCCAATIHPTNTTVFVHPLLRFGINVKKTSPWVEKKCGHGDGYARDTADGLVVIGHALHLPTSAPRGPPPNGHLHSLNTITRPTIHRQTTKRTEINTENNLGENRYL